jgi:cytochrome c553
VVRAVLGLLIVLVATATFLPAPVRAQAAPAPAPAAAAPAAAPASAPVAGAAAKPDPSKADKIAQEVCAACHGADGNSTAPANPKIAGQHPEYVYKQLVDFKVKEGAKVALRNNAVMSAMVANLSDADMRNLAAFYGGKPLKPSFARMKDLVERGQAIYRGGIAEKGVPACAGCHGPRGEGMPAQYPSLHGQYADYTEAELVAFRSGERANNGAMMAIAARMSDGEIKAVADYVAGLR